jgi:PAS domain S-box-containing protein
MSTAEQYRKLAVEHIMLDQFSDQVRECHERAAAANAKAHATDDPILKADLFDMERRWLALARNYGCAESLEGFTTTNSDPTPLRNGMEQVLWFASIVESTDDAIITKNLDGIITSWNKAAQRLFGYTAEEVIGKSITILIPPEQRDEEPVILDRIRRGERIDHYETVRQRKDGSLFDISLTVSPIKNVQGEIVGASKIARDITERRRNDEHIITLAREAQHRTRNILATVQATVNLSHSDTPDGLKRAIEGRIQALANVHDLLVKSRWAGAELSSIATQELAPYLGMGGGRARIDGPHVLLSPNTAQSIAVTLHELATNAAKYGSLSTPTGQAEITWIRAPGGRLILHWTESGGPPTKKPTRQGFGTSVIERMIREQLKGEMHLDWRTEGLACEIVVNRLAEIADRRSPISA